MGNTVILGKSSATAAEQSINSGSTNGVFPTYMQIPVGTTVTFTNPGSNANTHCATQFFEGLFNFSLAPGQSASYTFTQGGRVFLQRLLQPALDGKDRGSVALVDPPLKKPRSARLFFVARRSTAQGAAIPRRRTVPAASSSHSRSMMRYSRI